ncbi:MAG: hypothetical protein H6708_04135 [Kofleriaceae bacterium]|nr:hypothetical protein [Kofleriaceae bacterium]
MIYPPEGYCLKDDFSGTVCSVDADCGDGGQCIDTGGYRWCLPKCDCIGDACPEHQTCYDKFLGFDLDKMSCVPGDTNAHDGDACDGEYECFPETFCRNNPLEYPGGQCYTPDCTVGDNSVCNGGVCEHIVDFGGGAAGAISASTPATPTQTAGPPRATAASIQGRCGQVLPAPAGRRCCATAADCSGGVWECRTGVTYPGGYCTVTACSTPGGAQDCSPNSICYDDPLATDNFCVDRCATVGVQSTCRTGYVCADVDPGAAVKGGCVPL